jgi:hypothetical protein
VLQFNEIYEYSSAFEVCKVCYNLALLGEFLDPAALLRITLTLWLPLALLL